MMGRFTFSAHGLENIECVRDVGMLVSAHLSERALSEHLEQLELRRVRLLRPFLDHVRDVDLFDDIIFLWHTAETVRVTTKLEAKWKEM